MNFYKWLTRQRDRNDPVGDLARDARRDSDFPRNGTLTTLHDHLTVRHAIPLAHTALDEAWQQWTNEASQ